MANYAISVNQVKAFLRTQYYDEQNWAQSMKLLRAAGVFVGSVILMRSYGDMMAI